MCKKELEYEEMLRACALQCKEIIHVYEIQFNKLRFTKLWFEIN